MTSKRTPTLEQLQRLAELDAQERDLEQRLKILRERRREYININELNKLAR